MNDLISSRDAVARARLLANNREAEQLLQRALLSGDRELATAIRNEAAARGWFGVSSITAETPAALADRLRGVFGTVLVTHKEQTQELSSPAAVTNMTPAGREAALSDIVSPLLQMVADARTAAADNALGAKKAFTAVVTDITGTPTDPTEALLAETRMTKAWNRIIALHKGDQNPFTYIKTQLEQANDPIVVAAILTEAPTWLRQVSREDTDHEDTLLAIAAGTNPTLRRALISKKLAAKVSTVTEFNAKWVTTRLSKVAPTYAQERARSADELLQVVKYVDPITSRGGGVSAEELAFLNR